MQHSRVQVAVLDACVLYPTVMREIVVGCARAGLLRPLWSDRILEEWARAAARLGAEQAVWSRGEIARLRDQWPGAEVPASPALEAQLYLPDPNDTHVLAAAISGGAQLIITANLKDFPNKILAEHGLLACHPDVFLCRLLADDPGLIQGVAEQVRRQAEALSGEVWPMRKLMKKARLPRFGKALERG